MSKPFEWGSNGEKPCLEAHSVAKLNVLRKYVVDYLQIRLKKLMGKEQFPITFVDAFAGGGLYLNGEKGSPLVFLEAVKEAEALINLDRHKPVQIDAHFYFVEQDKAAFASLRASLDSFGYGPLIGKSIFLFNQPFDAASPTIVANTRKRHPRGGSNIIIFLDQCGYTDVHAAQIKRIYEDLEENAEFILNFACDFLLTYLTDSAQFAKAYRRIGIDHLVTLDDLKRTKDESGGNWKHAIEARLGPALQTATGMPYFSPFYIEPANQGGNGYWLVHLAPHSRARSAMVDVYWDQATYSRHYGNTGLQMLAYRPDIEDTGYLTGLEFDENTRDRARKNLSRDLARAIKDHHRQGLTFTDLCQRYSNDTIANTALLREVVQLLVSNGEVRVTGAQGGAKRTGQIHDDDVIFPDSQQVFLLSPAGNLIGQRLDNRGSQTGGDA